MCPDIFGSIGGFIFGALIGISMLPIKMVNNLPVRKERILFWFTVITSIGLYVLFIVLFFTVKKPQLFWYYNNK